MKPDYIVAIGGSAGSLMPMVKLFSGIYRDNACYVVLRHIAANAVSQLDRILRKHSTLQIKEIEDLTELNRNTVYILPPGSYAILADGKIALVRRRGYPNCAIDVFMNSMSMEYKNKAIGIILSGTGTNGTEGIINIKKNGGLVLVQQPASCEFASMPESAIETGCVDKILLPEEMP
ncbi:MAG: chemotaxis protein CheB, partial [Flavipsychrobacter sp.]